MRRTNSPPIWRVRILSAWCCHWWTRLTLAASIVAQGKTLDPTGTIKLINGNVECTTCHNPHVQSTDVLSPNFLLINSANGQLCLACHDPNRVMTGKPNPFTGWASSIHALATNKVSSQANAGSYPSVAQNSCISCHAPHNAQGGSRLLRQPNEKDCVACHSGGTNMAPATMNVFGEFATPKVGHPYSTGTSIHDAAESNILNNNRHSPARIATMDMRPARCRHSLCLRSHALLRTESTG